LELPPICHENIRNPLASVLPLNDFVKPDSYTTITDTIAFVAAFPLFVTFTATDSTLPREIGFLAIETVTPSPEDADTLDTMPESNSEIITMPSTDKSEYLGSLFNSQNVFLNYLMTNNICKITQTSS